MSYSTRDVAKMLGVSENTIRLWIKELKAPHQKKGQRIRFNDAHLQVLKTIKEFRDNESGYDTIKRVIHGGNITDTSPDMAPSAEHMRTIIVEAIQEQTGMALELSKSTYQVGKLEATCAQLDATCANLREGLTERDQKIFELKQDMQTKDKELLTLGAEIDQKTKKEARLSEDNQALKKELDQLKEDLMNEKNKTWWDRLMGR